MTTDSIKTRELPTLPPDWIILLARALQDEYKIYGEIDTPTIDPIHEPYKVTTEELADFIWTQYLQLP